jgi:DNA primase
MYITDIDEAVTILRSKLKDYLIKKLGVDSSATKIRCFAHEDHDPSMHFNPKTANETVKCFSCGFTGDIFSAANILDNLPLNGPEWLHVTIPTLCDYLAIPYSPGELSLLDKEKINLYKLAQDISDILSNQRNIEIPYLVERNWIQQSCVIGSIDSQELISILVAKGWDAGFVNQSNFIKTKFHTYFGKDKITFAIKDHVKRTVGFICRNLIVNDDQPKYVNNPETLIYKKNQALMGIDVALHHAKKEGLYIVEGPGDLMQLYRLGILNAVAVCGTAFTESHLLYLKTLGIKKIFLNFDWDKAGYAATQRILENILKATSGVNCFVVSNPRGSQAKDPDEYLKDTEDPNLYLSLEKITSFDWLMKTFSDTETPDVICMKMIPVIAAEDAAIKRELLIKSLSTFTGISESSIATDVNAIRNNKFNEKLDKLKNAADKYIKDVEDDPDGIRSHMANHELAVENIEKEYRNNTIGINYQLSRFDAIQQQREESTNDETATSFKMNWFKEFESGLAGGMNWASGCLMYVGGRANSGKTATCLMIGTDIANSDENALVIIHSTDDSYEQIEPRIKTNLYRMVVPDGPKLSIGMMVQPNINLRGKPKEYHQAWGAANERFRQLIEEERIIVIDSEDGATLSVLERTLRYYRQRYPNKKILLVCDNTMNYMDFVHLDQTARITQISNIQKNLTVKYKCCMIATAEYRKNMNPDYSKLRLPVDDDLADARALMYRPNVIFHVYNDIHDRKEHAEIFWNDEEGNMRPRLLLHFTKNKISSFKEKLFLDLDPTSVTLKPVDPKQAKNQAERYRDLKDQGVVESDGKKLTYVDAEDYSENGEDE